MTSESSLPMSACASLSFAPKGADSGVRRSSLNLNYEKAQENFRVFNPEKPGPWVVQKQEGDKLIAVDDYDTFLKSLRVVEEAVRIYSVNGHNVKFVLKESYALAQDELRELRRQLEDESTNEEAAKKLAEHPYRERALPEDILPFIDQVVDSSYFGKIYLLDERNVHDLWVRQVKKDYNANFISSASVDGDDLNLYRREIEEYLGVDIFHEWAHRLEARYDAESKAFRAAILLEQRHQGWYYPSAYALTAMDEHWAVYGERMLADQSVFQETIAKSAPRAVVWMRALKKALLANSKPGVLHAQLLQRCDETERLYLAKAKEIVSAFLTHEDKTAVEQARLVLNYLESSELVLPEAA